jgi:hypothetical protein
VRDFNGKVETQHILIDLAQEDLERIDYGKDEQGPDIKHLY